jgi:hypothetical protein
MRRCHRPIASRSAPAARAASSRCPCDAEKMGFRWAGHLPWHACAVPEVPRDFPARVDDQVRDGAIPHAWRLHVSQPATRLLAGLRAHPLVVSNRRSSSSNPNVTAPRTSATRRCRRVRSTALATRMFCTTAPRATGRVHEVTRRSKRPCATRNGRTRQIRPSENRRGSACFPVCPRWRHRHVPPARRSEALRRRLP